MYSFGYFPGVRLLFADVSEPSYQFHTLHPALEDGTDRGFRNVGKQQSHAGEIPKRIHAIFKIRRKFEIKKLTFIYTKLKLKTCHCRWLSFKNDIGKMTTVFLDAVFKPFFLM
jgi:hypothetical protein